MQNNVSSLSVEPGSLLIPAHVAIIMDGNGRWARARGLPRTAGHKKGSESLRKVMEACRKYQVRYLTVYAFSSENWKRPLPEIADLMELLRFYLKKEIKTLAKNNIALHFIGNRERLSKDIQSLMAEAEARTSKNPDFHLTIALSYGSQEEITRTMRAIAHKVQQGKIAPETIDETFIEEMLDTGHLPPPDLLIRTGGEHRLSNFLLWQAAYSELYFTDTLWPDFGEADVLEALQDFSKRERRYGTAE